MAANSTQAPGGIPSAPAGADGPAYLSADEERALAEARDAGDASARDQLIVRNIDLARRLAARYARSRPRHADAFASAALFALVPAADHFDPDRGRFSTVATLWVRRFLADAAARECPALPVPPYMVGIVRALAGRRPMPRRVPAGAAGNAEAARIAMAARASEPGHGRAEWPSAADRWDEDRDGETARLRDALATLGPEDRALIEARWGLGEGTPESRPGLAARMGVSPWTIRAAEGRIMARLRRLMGDMDAERGATAGPSTERRPR